MLDEKRIRLMTRMASYEEGAGKKNIEIASYFRADYITFNVVKTAISATVAFIVILAVYIYYNMESFIADIYKIDLVGMGRRLLTFYIATLLVYCIIAFIVYTIRYNRAKKSVTGYSNALKKLSEMYEDEY